MRIPFLILVTLAVTACGLAGFWFYAAGATGAALDRLLAAQEAQGQHISCPQRRISGFPIAIKIACDHPTFSGLIGDEQTALSLAGLTGGVSLLDPFRAEAHLSAPFTFGSSDGQAVFTLSWAVMNATFGSLPRTVDHVTFEGQDITASGTFWAPDRQTHRAVSAKITLHLAPDGPGKALEFKIDLTGLHEPGIDGVLGGPTAATSIALSGRITKPVFANLPAPELLELWRKAGGDITFWQARIVHGESVVEASGPLHLDPDHRIAGRLDARFSGLAPLLRRYGINPNLAKAGALLGALFGQNPKAGPAGDDAISLPLEFRDGRLKVGPFTTQAPVPRLY